MSQAAALQLRVLSGWHKGACASLDGNAGELALGSDASNDVLLRDAPWAQAKLRWNAKDWTLQHGQDDCGLPIGEALAWQDLRLAVVTPDAPWHGLPTRHWTPTASVASNETASETSPETSPEASAQGATESTAPTGASALPELAIDADETLPGVATTPDWRQRLASSRSSRRALIGLVGALTVATVWAWTRWLAPAPAPLPRPAAPPTASAPEVQPAQLQAALEQAGLSALVRVEKNADQRLALWGVVQDQDQLEAMLRVVMALTRKVVPHVLVQSEFVAQAQALQPMLPAEVRLTTADTGQVWLSGPPDAVKEAMAVVQRELPEAVQVRSGQPAVATRSPGVMASLPSIVAIQSGTQAYVMLANGQRILPGGQVNGTRLISIDGQSVVLEDANGQSRRIER